jgi:hypothetical protein
MALNYSAVLYTTLDACCKCPSVQFEWKDQTGLDLVGLMERSNSLFGTKGFVIIVSVVMDIKWVYLRLGCKFTRVGTVKA